MSPRTIPRVVLDTNTLVSALYREGHAREVLRLFYRGEITALVSPFLLAELKNTLTNKLHWPQDKVMRALTNLEDVAELIQPTTNVTVFAAHNNDNQILACALDGRADFLVTGDHELLKLRQFERTAIVTAQEFLATIGGL